MKRSFLLLTAIILVSSAIGQNTLNNIGLSASSPSQVAYGLRQLSSSYNGPALKVRRSSDNAEATIAFDGSTFVSGSSTATLTPGVTVNASLGTPVTGSISTVAAKTGTITIAVNKTGTISADQSSNVVIGVGTAFTTQLIVGDVVYRSSDNAFLGVVKSINSNTSLTLNNNIVLPAVNIAFRTQHALVTGSGTNFTSEFAVGDRIFNTSHTYLGTISSISSNSVMTLISRDAVAASGIAFEGSTNIITGSGTAFASGTDVGKMLISNNITLGIIASVESTTSLTLTTKAGAAVSGAAFKSTSGTMAFSTFYSGTSVFVNTWYDQSGYGRDAIQLSTVNQPRIVNAGTLILKNAKPSLDFSGGTSTVPHFLQTLRPASWLTNTLYSQNVVSAEASPMSAYQIPISTTSSGGPNNTVMHYGYRSPSQYTVAQYGNDQNFEIYATNSLEVHTGVKNSVSSSQMYHNGTFLGTVTSSAGSHMNDLGLLNIGYYIPTGSNYKGSISEITVFAQAITTEAGALNANQLAYYGISTTTWTGNTDSDWTKTTNWLPEVVPNSSSPSIVVIPNTPNKPVIGESVTAPATSILVQSGATLTVNAGGTLQLYGSLVGTGGNCYINGTLEFMNTGQTIISGTYNAGTISNLKLSGAGGSLVSMATDLKVQNDLNFGTFSKLYIQNSKLTLNGTVTGAGTQALRGSTYATLEIAGSAAPVISFDQFLPYNNIRYLIISTTGVVTLGSNLTVSPNGGLTFSNNGKLAIGSNTFTLSGLVTNTTTAGLRGSSNSNLVINGTVNRTLSFDQTTPGTTNLLNNFSLNTTSANTITAGNDFSINGTLTIASGQTLNMGTNAMGGTLNSVANSGTILTQNTSSTPIPTGKTWGGTVNYNSASTAQTAMAGTYNNLTIATTGGATASGDITVNGVLSLANNPNETNGALEMTNSYGEYSNVLTPTDELTTRHTAACDILDSDILTMGPSATYSGSGDVTGRVKRTTLLANTEYTFGSPYSTITFSSGGTMPSSVMFVITKGANRGIHANLTTTVERLYQIIQSGGSGNTFALKLKYMDSELNGNSNESNLVLWDHHIPYSSNNTPHQHGKTSQNSSENWVSLSGHAISYLATTEEIGGFSKYWMINTSTSTDGSTWLGAAAGDAGYSWDFPSNWTAGAVPDANTNVIIPGGVAKYPTLANNSFAKSVTIQAGATVNGGNGTTFTVSGGIAANGGVGSWNNAGTFNAGSSTVIFDYVDATLDGTTDFYNLSISSSKTLTPQSSSVTRVAGSISNSGTLNTQLFNNTFEYNGTSDQVVINPNGTPAAYRNLSLSGSGTKTLPSSTLTILGNLSVAGTATASNNNSIEITGNLTIGSGTTFNAGNYTHSLQGNFTNNGTFSGNGSTLILNGTSAQSIGGTEATTFGNLTIDNAAGVTFGNNLVTTVSGNMLINSGKKLTIDNEKKLTVNGNLTNSAGNSGLIINTGGSLITNGSVSGSATVLRTIDADEWHLISSPVSNAVSGMFTDQYLQTHNEVSNLYSDIIPTDVSLLKVKGYALWTVNNPYTAQFEGTLNTGNQSIATAKINQGWNLVGNPYPSSIDWESAGITKSNINPTVYMHVDASKWATYNATTNAFVNGGSQYIPPCQGFFVEATGAGSLAMTNTARTHTTNQFFKSGDNTIANLVRLQVSGNGYTDEAVVVLFPGSTTDFDGALDARKLFGYVPEAAQIYTLGTSELSINTLPEAKTVPVGLQTGADGNYTIEATEINDFSELTLEDRLTGILTDLMSDSYTFNCTAGKDEQRFLLHFGPLSVEDNTLTTLADIYSYQKTVYINLHDLDDSDIYIYNMAGQVVAARASATGMVSMNVNTSGIYIVKVVTKNEIQTKKLFLN